MTDKREQDPPPAWLDDYLRGMARDAIAASTSRVLKHPEDHVCWIAADRLKEANAEIERLRDALDEIHRHCGDNGETNGDRDRRWAAEVARTALSAGK